MVLIISCAILAGCGKKQTLEEYYSSMPDYNEQIASQMEEVKLNYIATFDDMFFRVEGNTVVYEYIFREYQDSDEFSKNVKQNFDQCDSSFWQELKKEAVGESDIKNSTIKYIYKNPDGRTIAEYEKKL